MKERRSQQVFLSKAELARQRKIENLFSKRSNIQREMAAINPLSDRYLELQQELRETIAKLASA